MPFVSMVRCATPPVVDHASVRARKNPTKIRSTSERASRVPAVNWSTGHTLIWTHTKELAEIIRLSSMQPK